MTGEHYRPEEEINEWKARDPLKIIHDKLTGAGIKEEVLKKIDEEISIIIDDAEKFAKESSFAAFEDSMQL